ncbi:hypothetical protein ACIBK9_02350 [Nonomuraea sp. NPDC050227]|uniref:hypothetical protein n=1 Tax=Nonomuraea sp. NPDC050227 TaxID=3364360 RepID=UPI00378E6E43
MATYADSLIAPADGRGWPVVYSDRDLTGGLEYGPVEQVDRTTGYCGIGGVGVVCPVGLTSGEA